MTERNVLITGAGRGLGLGLARCFTDDGARVIGTARDTAAATALADVADRAIELDVGSDTSITDLAASVAGLGHLDILVNNAGIDVRALRPSDRAGDGRGTFDVERDELLGVLDVNVAGPLLITRALRPLLVAAPAAIVVNISSQLGSMSVGASAGRDVAYNASKAALNMVTAMLANSLRGDGVTVVALHPGWVQTDMGGPAASLTVEESAAAVVKAIGGLSIADSGHFFRWDGSPHPW